MIMIMMMTMTMTMALTMLMTTLPHTGILSCIGQNGEVDEDDSDAFIENELILITQMMMNK